MKKDLGDNFSPASCPVPKPHKSETFFKLLTFLFKEMCFYPARCQGQFLVLEGTGENTDFYISTFHSDFIFS